jgi:hypothetical protein
LYQFLQGSDRYGIGLAPQQLTATPEAVSVSLGLGFLRHVSEYRAAYGDYE